MPSTETYCARMHTGSRTYFFDVKSSEGGGVRLEVTESRHRPDGYQRNTVTVFQEDAARFLDELLKAVSRMPEAHSLAAVRPAQSEPEAQRLPRFQSIKRRHPNAYAKWTPEEDSELKQEVAKGTPIAEIARGHSRQPNAIRSRIEKLGL